MVDKEVFAKRFKERLEDSERNIPLFLGKESIIELGKLSDPEELRDYYEILNRIMLENKEILSLLEQGFKNKQ